MTRLGGSCEPKQSALAKKFAPEKASKWPRFFEVAHNLHAAIVNFTDAGDSSDALAPQQIIMDHVQLHEATGVSSKINGYTSSDEDFYRADMHKPVLDLDCPHFYCESTTDGHAHLIIDVDVSWKDYIDLLTLLVKCRILEPGYVNVALARGESWMRTPWTRKEVA